MPRPVDVPGRSRGDSSTSSADRRRRRRTAAAAQRHCAHLPSNAGATTVTSTAVSTASATRGIVFAATATAVFVYRLADPASTGGTSSGAASVAALARRRSLACGHRPADRTKVQYVHLGEETASPPSPSSPAAAAAPATASASTAAARLAAAAATAARTGAGRQTRVGDTEAEHRGARPEQSAADRRGAVHTGHGVLDAHTEGAVDHASEEDRLLHGRAHCRHAVP